MSSEHAFQICIATGQNAVNLIPALQCGAEEVWILETPSMASEQSGHSLRKALKNHDIDCKILPFPESDPAQIQEAAEELAARIDAQGRRPIINLTGGTKLMTLALVQQLSALLDGSEDTRPALVYTNSRDHKLDWLAPRPQREPMQGVLTINDVLHVYGYEHDSSRSSQAQHDKWLSVANDRKDLTCRIAERIDGRKQGFVGRVSAVAGLAGAALKGCDNGGVFHPDQRFNFSPDKELLAFVDELDDADVLDHDHGLDVHFKDEEAARYCAGTWLEEFVALRTADVKQYGLEIRGGWRANVYPKRVRKDVFNEVDLMVVHDNLSLVVECKAAHTHDGEANKWLDRLNEVATRVAGSHATRLLVSARQLTETQLERAELMGINVCSGSELRHFARYLHEWLRTGRMGDGRTGAA